MPDLQVGETMEMQGSGARPYIIKNCGGGGYSCTCPAWRNQSLDPARRTCKHIRKLRGDAAEEERIGSVGALPSRKPEKVGAPPVLLAEAWDTQTNLAGWWMSEKLDGVRAYWDGKQFLSRQGNLYLAPPWFVEGLPDTHLDGELWVARKQFNSTVSIVKSQDLPDRWQQVRYVVFDAPQHDGEFEARLRFLEGYLGKYRPPFVQALEQQQCKSTDHLRAELARIEALGGEGLMMREPGSRYIAGRSSTLLKVKTFHDAEAEVVGYLAGEGKHKGRLGSLRAKMPNGLLFSVGTGLSDAERNNPPPIGTIITYRFQELTETGVPRFPSYVGLRRDNQMTATPATPALGNDPAKIAVVVPAVPPPAAPAQAVTRAFDYGSVSGSRFWEVTQRGSEVTIRFGLAGGDGVTKTQQYDSQAEAAEAVAEMIADKLDDGFVERGTAPPAAVAPAPKPKPAMVNTTVEAGVKRYFELAEGDSGKFWEVWVTGCEMWTRHGKIGSKGSKTVKTLDDQGAALLHAAKMIQEKTRKGYSEKT